MLRQYLVGSSVTAINILIHASITVVVVRVARATGLRKTLHPWSRLLGAMIATASVLIVAHTLEVIVWCAAYLLVNAAPDNADAFDFAFVNYTTLGYGDVTPSKGWRLLGPMTAMNGVLMFGWSTAVIFEVLRKTIDYQAALSAHPDDA